MPRARITFRLPRERARIIESSLKPEVGREIPRTRFRIKAERDGLVMEVEADDLNVLRAALNSYCRWIDVAQRTLTLV